MNEITRLDIYTMTDNDNEYGLENSYLGKDSNLSGEFVYYEDHASIVAEYAARCARLEEQIQGLVEARDISSGLMGDT